MDYHNLRVDDVMSTALVTAKPNEAVGEGDFEMRLANIRHLPIVDDNNHLVGIVSSRDLLVALQKRKKSVMMKDVMTTDVRTIRYDQPAHRAVADLMEFRIGCLPVEGDRGQLVGVVTETDFLRVAHQALGGEEY